MTLALHKKEYDAGNNNGNTDKKKNKQNKNNLIIQNNKNNHKRKKVPCSLDSLVHGVSDPHHLRDLLRFLNFSACLEAEGDHVDTKYY